jgi:hypothetical protein
MPWPRRPACSIIVATINIIVICCVAVINALSLLRPPLVTANCARTQVHHTGQHIIQLSPKVVVEIGITYLGKQLFIYLCIYSEGDCLYY